MDHLNLPTLLITGAWLLIDLGSPCAALAGQNLTSILEIEAYFHEHPACSVEDFLFALSPEIRSRFQLVYQSRSPAPATLERPRIVLSSPDGSLLIGVSGDATYKIGNTVEIFSSDPVTGKFALYERDFSANAPELTKNPPSCLKCHADSRLKIGDPVVRPFWDGYPDWPGVFGTSHNGRLSGTRKLFGAGKIPNLEFEEAGLARLQKEMPPRYAALVDFDRVTVDSLATASSTFTDALARMNAQNLLGLYQEKAYAAFLAGEYPAFRRRALDFIEHEILPSEFPPDFLKKYLEHARENYARSLALKKERFANHLRRYGSTKDLKLLEKPIEMPLAQNHLIARNSIVFLLAGIDPTGYSTTREAGTFAMHEMGSLGGQVTLRFRKGDAGFLEVLKDPEKPRIRNAKDLCRRLVIPSADDGSETVIKRWYSFINRFTN